MDIRKYIANSPSGQRQSFHENIVQRQLEDLKCDITRNTTLQSTFDSELLASGYIKIQAKISTQSTDVSKFHFEKCFTVDPLRPATYHRNVRLDLMELYFFSLRFYHKPGVSPSPPVYGQSSSRCQHH
jgi:hypothetical protein